MYKHLLTLLLILTISSFVQGQSAPPDTSDFPYWIDMMADPNVNFYQTQKAFNKYWENRNIEKGNGYKPFKRWEYNTMEIIDSNGNIPSSISLANEVEKYMSARRSASPGGGNLPGIPGSAPCLTSGNWVELGPRTMPTNKTGQPNGLGRINSLAFHPTDSNIIFSGTPAGGLWITVDGGTSWNTTTDTLVTLGVSAIAIDPQDPDTIYLGTGDRDASDSYGRGVLKSVDGGKTWTSANSGMGNTVVARLLIDPTNSQILLAATSSGIYRSTNGAGTWTRTETGNFKDLVFDAVNNNLLYAAKYSTASFWKSTDNGVNWTNITSGLPSGERRMAIGVSPADSNFVYALVTESRVFEGLYLSTNRGSSFSLMSDTPNIMDYSHLGTGTSGQAWYDLDIAVDPDDASIIYSAGVNVFQSLDSGKTWKISAHWVGSGGASDVHADNHILEYQTTTKTLFTGNDGGVYFTKDRGKNWPEISDGLGIAQIYRLGQSALSKDLLINGYQDNGTGLYNNGTWYTIMGGDGMDCVIDPSDDTWAYSDLYYGDIRRYKNNSSTGTIGKNGVNGINEAGGWITPFILRESAPSTMFAGYKNVWRTTDAQATPASTVSWKKISDTLGGTNSQNIIALENSSVDDNRLYMSKGGNMFFRTDDANAATPSWTDLTSSLPNNSSVIWIESHRTFRDRLWICQSNKIYQSDDGGSNWTNISSGLPNLPILCAVFDSSSTYQGMYVGTYMGVFYKDTTMSSWIWYNDKMPINTRVRDIEIYYSPSGRGKSHVVCATYGRGNWRSPLYDENQQAPIAGFDMNKSSVCQNQAVAFSDTTENNPTRWLWQFSPSSVVFLSNTDSCSQNPVVQFTAKGKYSVWMFAANCKGVDSIEMTDLIEVFDPITTANCTGVTTNIGNYGIGIFGVDLAGYSHSSVGSEVEGEYVDRSCTEILNLKTDTAYFATITTGKTYSEYVKVFIDFNNNGSLNDAGEMVFDGVRGKPTHQDSIRIPVSPVTNTLLRMRVMSDFDTIPANACDTLKYGQTEDFGVVIESRFPTAHFGIDTNRICKNGKITLTDSSSGSIYNQRWYVSKYGLLTYKSDSAGPITFTLPDTGWYYAELVLNDSSVSKRIDSIVYVQPVPTSNLTLSSGSASNCEGGSLHFENQASPSSLTTSKWFKRGAEITGETDTFLALSNMTSADTGSYYSTVDWNGCVAITNSIVVYVNPSPIVDYTPDKASSCFLNNSFSFTNNTTLTKGSLTYSWSFGDGNTSTSKDPAYSYSDTGTHTVELIATSSDGCKDTFSSDVLVFESPAAGFTINTTPQCLNENDFSFSNTSSSQTSALTYNWEFGDGNSDTATNPNHTFAAPNTFTVQLVVQSSAGCADTLSQDVDVLSSPIADFNITPFEPCGPDNLFSFNDVSTVGSGSITKREWDFGDGSVSGQQNVTNKNFNGIGAFDVTLVVTTNLGCTDTAMSSVIIDAKPTADFSVNSATQCFNGHSVSITNSSTISSGSMSSEMWDFDDGNTSSSSNPPDHIYANPGTYTIRLITTSDQSCLDTFDLQVEINPSPQIDFTGGEGCVFDDIDFVNLSSISGGSLTVYEWHFGDGFTSSILSPSHLYVNSGTYEVKLIVTSDKGCIDSLIDKTAAVIYEQPMADFTIDKISSIGNQTEMQFNDVSTGGTSRMWVFDMFGSSTEPNPIVTFGDTGTFAIMLITTNDAGCADTMVKAIFVFPDNLIHLPNSFTPNGDDLNEVFKPYGLGYLKKYHFAIYNRWGVKVFETIDTEVGWDGNYLGEVALPGVYLVTIDYTDLNNLKDRIDTTLWLMR